VIFPRESDAPKALVDLEGGCGPIALWMVLRHFRIRTDSARIIRACRYSTRSGVFTVGMAVALAEHGLSVAFHTRRDRHRKKPEMILYPRARQLGVAIRPAIGVASLVATISAGAIPIVFYRHGRGVGHFAPLTGFRRGALVLPNTETGRLSVSQFRRAWRKPGFLQQCVIARRKTTADSSGQRSASGPGPSSSLEPRALVRPYG
jgi:hypothetical protein